MASHLYSPVGEAYVPSDLAHGPWVQGMQHGGPPAALLARALEGLAPEGMRPARLTVDLFRVSPMAAVEVEAEVQREGRRIGVYSARLRVEGNGHRERHRTLSASFGGWRDRTRRP